MTELKPFSANIMNIVRYSQNIATKTDKRFIKNYELDFQISGNRKLTSNNEIFTIGNGSVIFRKPGDYVTSIGEYNCYCLTLDFSGLKQKYYEQYDRNNSDDSVQPISSNHLLNCIPPHFVSPRPADYIDIFDQIYYAHQLATEKETCSILLNQLFFLILSDVFQQKNKKQSTENKIFTDTCKYIQDNYRRSISTEELAANVSLSPSYFIKIFKKISNTTPTDYLISIRLQNAKLLLAESDLSVSIIADLCGFNDASYFSYYFKKAFGITPKQYRLSVK